MPLFLGNLFLISQYFLYGKGQYVLIVSVLVMVSLIVYDSGVLSYSKKILFLAIWGRRFSQRAEQAMQTEKGRQDTQTILMQRRVPGPASSQASLGLLETGRQSGAPRGFCQCQSLALSDAGLLEIFI